MKKACGLWLLVYALLGAAIGAIVYRRFPVAAIPAAIFGGFLAWVGVAYFAGIGKKIQAVRTIRGTQAGATPLDGEKVAAIGRIVPIGNSLVSPFTKTSCVAYAYDVSFSSNDSNSYTGFALTSSAVQGMHGSLRLLSNPDLKISPQIIPADQAMLNADEYFKTATFRMPNLDDLRKLRFTALQPPDADENGNVRFDRHFSRMGGDGDLSRGRFSEKVVRAGEPVCVIGYYSASRGGIVAGRPNGMLTEKVTLERGESGVFVARAVRSAIGYLIAGIIFLGLATAGVVAVLAFVPLEAAEQMNRSMNPTWPEIRFERFIEKRVRGPMRQAGMLSSNETVSITLPDGTAHGRVRVGGRDVVVSHATAVRKNDQTIVTIDDGAATIAVDSRDSATSVRLFGQEVPIASVDSRIGGYENEIEGRLFVMQNDVACRLAFRAAVQNR